LSELGINLPGAKAAQPDSLLKTTTAIAEGGASTTKASGKEKSSSTTLKAGGTAAKEIGTIVTTTITKSGAAVTKSSVEVAPSGSIVLSTRPVTVLPTKVTSKAQSGNSESTAAGAKSSASVETLKLGSTAGTNISTTKTDACRTGAAGAVV